MADRIRCYRPAEGADLVVKLTDGGENVAYEVARRLHDRYVRERTLQDKSVDDFLANWVYLLSGGLIFRVFDGGVGPDDVVLEFLANPDQPQRRAEILATIPETLAEAGVESVVVDRLREFLASDARSL